MEIGVPEGASGQLSGKWGDLWREEPERLFLLPQRPLLASEGTCTQELALGAPAALPP